MTHRETSAQPDRADWQLAQEYLHRARYADPARLAELFTDEEIARATAYLAAQHPDADRLAAIEARLKAVPSGWRQRDGDTGVIEDSEGRPVAVLGTSGAERLPLGEFLAAAPADTEWLTHQLRQAWAQLDRLRDRIDDAGSLMHVHHVATAIDYVPGSREPE
jgi:phosphopantetheinyl transferase (holo-ACP synthase)